MSTLVEAQAAPNPEQAAAIGAAGTVFVSAGAGTGKTTVIVERFLRAVESGADVGSILVVTFTERAAGELRTRIRSRLAAAGRADLARELDGAWISTIHGFCHRLLRTYPTAAGVDPRFRVLDESQASVLRAESFAAALSDFCAGEHAERIRLLATYGAEGLRRMLSGVAETLRAAGRPLELGLEQEPDLATRVGELRAAAEAVLGEEGDAGADDGPGQAARAIRLLDSAPPVDLLLDLSGIAVKRRERERFVAYEDARRALEQTALNVAAVRDRELLQDLLERFDRAYQVAKDAESALDFEDLQLRARELLRDDRSVAARERLRFRSIMVDEFQDTNRLQCEIIDLLSASWPATAPAGRSPASPAPDAAGGRIHRPRPESVPRPYCPPASDSPPLPATPQEADSPGGVEELFFVGDEFQSIYRFRHADVEVFKERRAESAGVLPLRANYRSRPELLDVVNELFAADFGSSYEPLVAAGRFPDPAKGPAVELLVTDKASYKEAAGDWRRGEARAAAARVRELCDAGEATPGEVVFLFAAGTDADVFEDELRAVGLPTYRAAGRGYFAQQQVLDVLAYLRLLHNRYDDEALAAVLASPLVGVSNDALVLLRRSAGRRPLFTGIEREPPAGLAPPDEQLFRAFRQRYDRLVALTATAGLERLIDQVVCEHDYDLAVLAQPDGRRRYANLRKLGRLARSYEDLRGRDVEGFVRFISDRQASGAHESEAFAEEEGGDAVRLLTIHAAKGLEFRVVVVADAGRSRPSARGEEIICRPDGRFGFKVLNPATGKRHGAFDYDAVRRAEEEAEEAERLRLYYVAMTRAIDRLLVSGSIDPGTPGEARTPMAWVLERLGSVAIEDTGDGPVVLEHGRARLALRVDRCRPPQPEHVPAEPAPPPTEEQLTLFSAGEETAGPQAGELAPLPALQQPPVFEPRRLSYSALATFDECPAKFYARYVAGMRERRQPRVLGAVGVGAAVHELLETLDHAAPAVPVDLVELHPDATEEELARMERLLDAYRGSELAGRLAALEGAARKEQSFAFEHDGVVLHGFMDVLHLDRRALVVDFKTNALDGESAERTTEEEYRLQRLVYALACFRAGAEEVEVVYQFLEQPDAPVVTLYTSQDVPRLEDELTAAIVDIRAGAFPPRPSERACADCPALDVVCAGPRLRIPVGA